MTDVVPVSLMKISLRTSNKNQWQLRYIAMLLFSYFFVVLSLGLCR